MHFGGQNAALLQSRMTKKTWNLLLGIIRSRYPPGAERDLWECWALELKTQTRLPGLDEITAECRDGTATTNPEFSDRTMTLH